MDNYKLLKKYRKRMSVYFAVFVLLSIWGIVLFFDFSDYFRNNINEKRLLANRSEGIVNIIKNNKLYSEIEEFTLRRVISKVLRNSVIIKGDKLIFSEINDFEDFDKIAYGKFLNIDNYKYHKAKYKVREDVYTVVTRREVRLTMKEAIMRYVYFIIFSLPFYVFYYFIGYYFIGRNLKPIQENMVSMEEFVGNINHEFKTPLSEIISSLELSKKTKNFEDNVDTSIKSAKKLTTIVNSLSGFIETNNFSFKKQDIDLVAYSKEIIGEHKKYIEEKKLKIEFSPEKSSYTKNINADHYHICFSNILSNAIKYSKEKGKIKIGLDLSGFEVKDNGVGIEKKYLEKIFDRFFRENYISDGKGLGLSLVKKVADINNWKIDITSEKGSGTSVKILF